MLYVRKVGIVGSGAMGSQIAEIMALNGYDVYMKDVAREFLDKGMSNIKKSLDDLVLFHKTKADKEISRIRRAGHDRPAARRFSGSGTLQQPAGR